METHHHPASHEKKTWKTYLFEFFMLFFAVFCGFLAEYQLELKIEREKEKQFILSMADELQADLVQIGKVQSDTSRYKNLDTLAMIFLEGDRSSREIKKAYELYFNYAGGIVSMSFNRNTLTQLKNAGNMRLIRKMNVVDSLNQLDNIISTLNVTMEMYQKIVYDNGMLGARVFDPGYMIKKGEWIKSMETFRNDTRTVKFVAGDRPTLIEFGGRTAIQSHELYGYHRILEHYRKYSVRLIAFLKKEYHLEKEG